MQAEVGSGWGERVPQWGQMWLEAIYVASKTVWEEKGTCAWRGRLCQGEEACLLELWWLPIPTSQERAAALIGALRLAPRSSWASGRPQLSALWTPAVSLGTAI